MVTKTEVSGGSLHFIPFHSMCSLLYAAFWIFLPSITVSYCKTLRQIWFWPLSIFLLTFFQEKSFFLDFPFLFVQVQKFLFEDRALLRRVKDQGEEV